MNCPFCRLISGEFAATVLFEDDLVFAFLDIAPVNPGHTLIIPKDHHASITTVPESTLARMMSLAAKLGQHIARVVDGDGFNLHLSNGTCAGQAVPHCHLHVIPRLGTDGFTWGWRSLDSSDDDRNILAEAIRKRLAGLSS
jgi:histidine triad (HIT) family protein